MFSLKMASSSNDTNGRDGTEFEKEVNQEVKWIDDGEEEEEARTALAIIGKVWAEKSVNSNALIDMMRKVWNPKCGVEANCIEKNTYFFQFHHWRDKEYLMDNQPWHFDRHIMVLSDVIEDYKPSEMNLFFVPFWVRVYDLPIKGRFNEANAKILGDKIGTFIKVDKSDVIGINKSLRLRVMVDVREPLKKEVSLTMRGGVKIRFPFK